MSFSERFVHIARFLLPTPFTIAVLLTLLTFFLAFFLAPGDGAGSFLQILHFWEEGLWNPGLLVFLVQMMLMLVLGHVLALTKPIKLLIGKMVKYCSSTASAAALVTFLAVAVSFINWGLGMIVGAVFARKVGEYATQNNIPLNYGLIGAAGYSGLMVWHGGLSGSAPIKVAEEGHFFYDRIGQISMGETVFSEMNITISFFLILILPLAMYWMGKKVKSIPVNVQPPAKSNNPSAKISGAEKLDHSIPLALLFGGVIIALAVYEALLKPGELSLIFLTPNYINFTLLGLGILLHKNFSNFLSAFDDAIAGVSGILLQFPLYFGIMGIMEQSGLVHVFSDFFVSISNADTYPFFTFISAGVVNVFVPSGGGQWAVQGSIIIEAAQSLNISLPKCIMAMAYGDQLTNMLQPFWALPLLGITGLKAKEIIPFTLFLMLLGFIIFTLGLFIF